MKDYQFIHRKKFFYLNKYQKQIIALVLIPTLILCILISVFITYFHKEIINFVLYTTNPPSPEFLNRWGNIILIVLWIYLIFVILWVENVSRKLVGAFGRILRELDEIIAGKEQKSIKARKDDELANELLKRINKLIEMLPKNPSSQDNKKIPGRF